jgi:hypothetical protein
MDCNESYQIGGENTFFKTTYLLYYKSVLIEIKEKEHFVNFELQYAM